MAYPLEYTLQTYCCTIYDIHSPTFWLRHAVAFMDFFSFLFKGLHPLLLILPLQGWILFLGAMLIVKSLRTEWSNLNDVACEFNLTVGGRWGSRNEKPRDSEAYTAHFEYLSERLRVPQWPTSSVLSDRLLDLHWVFIEVSQWTAYLRGYLYILTNFFVTTSLPVTNVTV